jgi:protein-tyrosine phosphatase
MDYRAGMRAATARSHGIAVCALLLLACAGGEPPELRAVPAELPAEARSAHRRLPLDGAHNFRDLGGYRTGDGRTLRWGRLYRSDALADLSDADLAYLRRLGLRRVVDFRSPGERERDEDRLPETPGLEIALRPIFGDALDPRALQDRLLSGEARGAELARLLVEANRAFVTDFGDVYAAFLRDLADAEELPLLFHCTAGKDRAGFAAAVALLALGVPREAVMRDYLLTNDYSADHTRRVLRLIHWASLFRADPEQIRPLFEARPEYLQAAFDTIDAKYGGVDRYLREGLGVDAGLRARLRDNLLE